MRYRWCGLINWETNFQLIHYLTGSILLYNISIIENFSIWSKVAIIMFTAIRYYVTG